MRNSEIIQNDVKNDIFENNISPKIDDNNNDELTLALIEKYETILAEKEMELNEKEMESNEKEMKLNEKYEGIMAEREMELIEKYEEMIAEKDVEIEDLKQNQSKISSSSQIEEGEDKKSNKTDQLFIEKLEMIEDYENQIENFKDIISKKDI